MSPVTLVSSADSLSVSGNASGMVKCMPRSFPGLCLPPHLAPGDTARIDEMLARRRRVARDTWLYRNGDELEYLYIVRYGHFKSVQAMPGRELSIGGFFMSGDLLGMEGIATGRHSCGVAALEDSEVCEISFCVLQELAMQIPGLLQYFHRAMSREIEREQSVMLFRSRMRADQRLAIFLLHLAERYAERGYSSTGFQLRMSREDIGAYLGLTVESVSRQLAQLRRSGVIAVHNRDLRIADRRQLEAVAAGVGEAVRSAA